MRLYAQNLLFFLPIFLFAVAVMGGSKFFEDRQEYIWGKQSAADAYAVSIAEFLTPERIDHLTNDVEVPFGIQHELDRIVTAEQLHRLAIYPNPLSDPLYEWGEMPAIPEDEWLSKHYEWLVERALYDAKFLGEDLHSVVEFMPLEADSDKVPTIRAAAPVQNGVGDLIAIVLIEKDISDIITAQENILWEIAKITGWVILIAVLASLALSYVVGRSVVGLTRSIQDVQKGQVAAMVDHSAIHEINHLENTYNTMIDVLIEEKERDRDDLMQLESVSVPNNVHPLFNRTIWPVQQCETGTIQGFAKLDENASSVFVDLHVRDNNLCGLIGQVLETGVDGMRSSTSTIPLWHSLLETHDTATALEILSDTLDMLWVQAVLIKPATPTTVQMWERMVNMPISDSTVELATDRTFMLNTFGGEYADTADMIVRRFGHNPPDVVAERIFSAQSEEFPGAILLIKA